MRDLERVEYALYGGGGAVFATGDLFVAIGLWVVALAATWIRASWS